MTSDLLKDRGTPVDERTFTWKELVQPPSPIDLAEQLGEQGLVEQLVEAERTEQDHLAEVRRGLQAGRLSAAS